MMVETLLADSHHQLKEAVMYAITGITGQVGGAVARALVAARRPVCAESPRNAEESFGVLPNENSWRFASDRGQFDE